MEPLDLLASMRRSLTESLDPKTVAREVLEEIQIFIPGIVGRLWVTDEDGESRHIIGSIGLIEDDNFLPSVEGLASLAITERRPKTSLDVNSDPRFVKKAFAKKEGLVSCIMLPLIHQGRCYGNLSLFTRQRHEFSAEEIELLESFVARAGVAVANVSVYRESVQNSEYLEGLHRISASIVSTLEVDNLLQLIVEEAAKLLRLDGAGLRLVEGDRLGKTVSSCGVSTKIMVKPFLAFGESVSGRVALENRPICLTETAIEGFIPAHRKVAESLGVSCMIGVPVHYHDRLLGVLISHGIHARSFTDEDVDLLTAFADHAAIAIENSRLFQSAQEEIAERKRIEETLREEQDNLQEMVTTLKETRDQLLRKERLATLGQLTGSVSHELRNPLGTIQIALETIEMNIDVNNKQTQRALDRARRGISRCTTIITDLLDFTRMQSLNFTLVSLGFWLDNVLDEHVLPDGVRLIKVLAENPEARIDENRFRQVIVNLLDNSIQALTENTSDSTDLHLTVSCRSEGDRILVEIKDNGPGIEDEVLPKIFEPLYSTKGFGIGLGLPIVGQIMEQHNGGITIDSDLGKGTRMKLWLPQ